MTKSTLPGNVQATLDALPGGGLRDLLGELWERIDRLERKKV